MIDELRTLEQDDTLIFLSSQACDFTEAEEMIVTEVRSYYNDDGEIVVVEMDDCCLICHNFQSEEQYYLYRLVDEGLTGDLEDEGYKFLNADDDFRSKIIVRDEDARPFVFNHSDTGAIYEIEEEVSLCEYAQTGNFLPLRNYIFIEKERDYAKIMKGFEIKEDDFKLKR